MEYQVYGYPLIYLMDNIGQFVGCFCSLQLYYINFLALVVGTTFYND